MKKEIKLLMLALILVLAFSAAPVCFADGSLDKVALEQADICVPEVNAYVYPTDADGHILYSLSEANTQISAVLGDETLSVVSFGSAKENGLCAIVLLNTSSEEIGYENLRNFKNDISNYIDKLGADDRFILITAGNKVEVLLDGSESREAAKRILNSVSSTPGTSDVISAINEAIRVSSLEKNSTPGRHVLALYDKGAFLKRDDSVLSQLRDDLIKNSLPMYFVCTRNNEEVQFAAANFAQATGGKAFHADSKVTETLSSWISGCYLLKAEGKSNSPEPRERNLRVTFSNGGSDCIIDTYVQVTGNIPDTTAPVLLNTECVDSTTIKVFFSEDVLNADDPANFIIEPSDGEHTVNVSEAVYDSSALSTTLTITEGLAGGDYRLSVSNITDTSYEANPLRADETLTFTWESEEEEKEEEEFPILYAAAAGGAVVVILIVILIVSSARKKKQRENDEMLEKEEKLRQSQWMNDEKTVNFVDRVDIESGLPVQLAITMPNGLVTKTQITVGNNFMIGRSKDANLKLDDETVSSKHLILSNVEGTLVAADNNSTNGTFINGVKIDRPHPLNKGDKVHIGNVDIRVSY